MAMTTVKITVVKKLDMNKLYPGEKMGNAASMEAVCPQFRIGDEFVLGGPECPHGFCPGAFADIYRYVSGLRAGANYPWMEKPGTVLACCTDGFRPVVFRLERIEES